MRCFLALISFIFLSGFEFADSFGAADSITLGSKQKPRLPDVGPMKTIFADIAAQVVPTVVSVIPTKIDTVLYFSNPFVNPRGKSGPPIQKKEFKVKALGSGVIISPDGYILTNYHVVVGASEIQVKLSDGRSFDSKVIGSDSLADVAVIKLSKPVKDLKVAYLGDSDKLRPGDFVVAVGNPFAFTSTVTMGIVSAKNRQVDNSQMYQDYIQTDAPINPGNSGGALVNINGEVVGINTMIYTETEGFMGIGFAVPINMAKKDAIDLITKGKVIRGWLGVSIQDIDPATAKALNLGNLTGVLVADVTKGSPADNAGIKRRDVILDLNGNPVTNANDLRNRISSFKPGTEVTLRVYRDGKEMDIPVKIGELTPGNVQKQNQQSQGKQQSVAFGITVADLSSTIRSQLNLPPDVNGVVVAGVDPSVTDARAGLTEGDVIEEIKISNGAVQSISSVAQMEKIAKGVKSGDPVMFLVYRAGSTFYLSFIAGGK
jgi:serine protease Do